MERNTKKTPRLLNFATKKEDFLFWEKKIGTGNSSKKGQKWAICTIYVVFWFGFGSVTEPLGSVVRPNLTEPPSSAEPEPEPEWFGRSLKKIYIFCLKKG